MRSATLDPPVEALLARSKFTSIYRDWLPARRERLAKRLGRGGPWPRNVLLLNATLGQTFYPEVIDFFMELAKARPGTRFVSASYFDEVEEFARGVARRGIPVATIPEVMRWTATELNGFDLVLAIGPSDAFARIMSVEGLTAKLVLVDLGFYHQLISEGGFLDEKHVTAARAAQEKPSTRVTCYSCQSRSKIRRELRTYFALTRFDWRQLPYIPVGFGRVEYYRSEEHHFDFALLGASARDYELIDASRLPGKRVLFVGSTDGARGLDRVRSELETTVVARASEDDYARLLALCRCIVMPILDAGDNVFLSVVDGLASGTPIIASRRAGFDGLESAGAPIVFYDEQWMLRRDASPMALHESRGATAASLAEEIRTLVYDEPRRRKISDASIAFAKRHLDIFVILETILREQAP
jgi:glycosyltransferase involved in cell wall biosynthesis